MIGSFNKSFKVKPGGKKLPKSVITVLDSTLPKGYHYVFNETLGHYSIVPWDTNASQVLTVHFNKEQLKEFPKWAKENFDALMDYLYRTQKSLLIKDAEIDAAGKKLSLLDFIQDPFQHQLVTGEKLLIPSPFPEPVPVCFELEDGNSRNYQFKRVPFDSRDKSKFQTVNAPEIDMTWIISEKVSKVASSGSIQVSVKPKKASTVEDALFAIRVLKEYYTGTLKICGARLEGKVKTGFTNFSSIENEVQYWQNLYLLQNLLHVKFSPDADFPEEDMVFYVELVASFLENKSLKYTEPIRFIQISKEALNDLDFKNRLMKENEIFMFSFIQGPNLASLLGAHFDLYVVNVIDSVMIDHIEEEGNDLKLFFQHNDSAPWHMIKKFALSEKEADEARQLIWNNLQKEKEMRQS